MGDERLEGIRETVFKSKDQLGIQPACDRDLFGRTCQGITEFQWRRNASLIYFN